MADDDKKKNMVVLGVCSVLLVAMVVALTIGTGRYDTTARKDVSSSEKAIQSICQPTTYRDACVHSLETSSAANATDPKELIEASMEITIKHLQKSLNNSTLFKELNKDPKSKEALDNCKLLGDRAVDDLNRTFVKFSEFDLLDLDNFLSDLKTWLSGALTYQETCLDGFGDVDGESQAKMKHVLTSSMQLTSNALAMVTDISSVLSNIGVEGINSSSKRRLLSTATPDWVDSGRRRLLTAKKSSIKPNLVVAKDGSGKYKTINEALKDIPRNEKKNKTFVLYIKEGVYEEQVTFFRNMTHLMIMGDGPTKTKITGNKNFIDGVSTFHTATVAALGDYFMARDIGFENSAGPEKHQAVALRVGADKSIFYNCQMDGYQDTLYTHTYRQFYRDCVISGTIDFIFGNGAVVLQNCTLVVRKPLDNQQNIVTAQGRIDPRQPTGLVLQNCSFVADPEYEPFKSKLKSYLGRPWKEYSRTIIMESYIGDLIQQDGWLPWNGDFALKTLFYTEYNNRGPASGKEHRVQWEGVKELPLNRIERFTAARFIQGDSWVKQTGLPYNSDLIFPPPKPKPATKYSPVVPDEIKDLGAQEKAEYDPKHFQPPASPKSPPPPVQSPLPPIQSPPPVQTVASGPSQELNEFSSAPTTLTTGSAPTAQGEAFGPVQGSNNFSLASNPASALGSAPAQAEASTGSDQVLSGPLSGPSTVQSTDAPVPAPAQVEANNPTQVSTPTSSSPLPSQTETATQVSPSSAPIGSTATQVSPSAAPVASSSAQVTPSAAPTASESAQVAPSSAPVASTSAQVPPSSAPIASSSTQVPPSAAPIVSASTQAPEAATLATPTADPIVSASTHAPEAVTQAAAPSDATIASAPVAQAQAASAPIY